MKTNNPNPLFDIYSMKSENMYDCMEHNLDDYTVNWATNKSGNAVWILPDTWKDKDNKAKRLISQYGYIMLYSKHLNNLNSIGFYDGVTVDKVAILVSGINENIYLYNIRI